VGRWRCMTTMDVEFQRSNLEVFEVGRVRPMKPWVWTSSNVTATFYSKP
jgi:hypothetical protein